MAEIPTTTPEVEPQAIFKEELPIEPCTTHVCRNGHKFGAVMSLYPCPSCHTPALMVLMANCPYCNEPVEKTVVRTDFLPRGAGMAKRCAGERVYGESLNIELERRYAKEKDDETQSG